MRNANTRSENSIYNKPSNQESLKHLLMKENLEDSEKPKPTQKGTAGRALWVC